MSRDVPHAGPLVVSIDQGTSATKAVAVDTSGSVVASATVPVGMDHPRPGWAEQDAVEILSSVTRAVSLVQGQLESEWARVVGCGLSSQRESAVAWDAGTGEPLGPVISWQDRRTRAAARSLVEAGHNAQVERLTGLPIDPMFSALKFRALLDEVDPTRARSRRGEIRVGTVDSWLLASLAGAHVIEAGNASRTQLMNIDEGDWSPELLDLFDVPLQVLPRIVASNHHTPRAKLAGAGSLPIGAVLADSHAALYGHGARSPGDVKVTYGTGSSVMGVADGRAVPPGLVRTIAWSTSEVVYGFEGNILSAGSTLVWLSRLLGRSVDELFEMASNVSGASTVDLVPAFSGLGAPWWDEAAEGLITGLTLGTEPEDIALAAFESIVLQVNDVLALALRDSPNRRVFADGGPTSNHWLMQRQADTSQLRVQCSGIAELSAMGAAQLAGISLDAWGDDDVAVMHQQARLFVPAPPSTAIDSRVSRWNRAVARARATGELSPMSHQRRTHDQ